MVKRVPVLRRPVLWLTLSLAVSGCSDPEVAPETGAPVAAAEPAEVAKPEPPKPAPTPTLTAVFDGAAVGPLVASGVARAAEPPPAPRSDPAVAAASASGSAEPAALLASAAPVPPAPAPEAAAAAAPPPSPPPAPSRAFVDGPAISATPRERPDDEVWTLPAVPAQLVWRHPAPAAGLQLELLEASRGRSWPTRVRVEADGDMRVATLTPLEPLPPGTELRLVARVVAADGRSLLWTEPLRVKPTE